jgi:cytochrome b subunit of formate dehydrogenase
MKRAPGHHALARLAKFQGTFYLVTGIWPWVAPGSFQAITGHKVDFWLAQTVGALLAATGLVLWCAARRASFPPEVALLAVLQAATLGVVDLWCVPGPHTTRAYLLDAVLEFALVAAWIVCWRRAGRRAGGS